MHAQPRRRRSGSRDAAGAGSGAGGSGAPRILKLLGNGSYGRVYLVEYRQREAVLKHVPMSGLTPAQVTETAEEASVMAALDPHPHVIQYYDSRISKDCLHIVMEHAAGGDLGHVLKRHRDARKMIPERVVWRYLAQLTSGLDHIHAHRVLHRDIKAANVFLDAVGDLKIGDFGLGRILGSQSRFARTTVGTPLYMAPELCEGRHYDDKSDVWSLGCLIYELTTLKPPFLASNQIALAKKIVEEPVPRVPDVYSRELRDVVAAMLHKEPSRRPSAAGLLRMPLLQVHLELSAVATARAVDRREVARLQAQVTDMQRASEAATAAAAAAQADLRRQQDEGVRLAAQCKEATQARDKLRAQVDAANAASTDAQLAAKRATAEAADQAATAAAHSKEVQTWAKAMLERVADARSQVATRASGVAARAEALYEWESALRHAHAALTNMTTSGSSDTPDWARARDALASALADAEVAAKHVAASCTAPTAPRARAHTPSSPSAVWPPEVVPPPALPRVTRRGPAAGSPAVGGDGGDASPGAAGAPAKRTPPRRRSSLQHHAVRNAQRPHSQPAALRRGPRSVTSAASAVSDASSVAAPGSTAGGSPVASPRCRKSRQRPGSAAGRYARLPSPNPRLARARSSPTVLPAAAASPVATPRSRTPASSRVSASRMGPARRVSTSHPSDAKASSPLPAAAGGTPRGDGRGDRRPLLAVARGKVLTPRSGQLPTPPRLRANSPSPYRQQLPSTAANGRRAKSVTPSRRGRMPLFVV